MLCATTPPLRPEMIIRTALHNPHEMRSYHCAQPEFAMYNLIKKQAPMQGSGEVISPHPPPEQDPGISAPTGNHSSRYLGAVLCNLISETAASAQPNGDLHEAYNPYSHGPLTIPLLKQLASKEYYKKRGWTELMIAAFVGDKPILEKLIEHEVGWKPWQQFDHQGRSVLWWAVHGWGGLAFASTILALHEIRSMIVVDGWKAPGGYDATIWIDTIQSEWRIQLGHKSVMEVHQLVAGMRIETGIEKGTLDQVCDPSAAYMLSPQQASAIAEIWPSPETRRLPVVALMNWDPELPKDVTRNMLEQLSGREPVFMTPSILVPESEARKSLLLDAPCRSITVSPQEFNRQERHVQKEVLSLQFAFELADAIILLVEEETEDYADAWLQQ